MRFISTLFWVILAVVAVFFALANWTPITLNLWSGLTLRTFLPVLVAVSFLIGFLPQWLVYRTVRFNMNRTHADTERQLAALRTERDAALARGAVAVQPSTAPTSTVVNPHTPGETF